MTLNPWSFRSSGVIVVSLFNHDSSFAWVTFFGDGGFCGVAFVDEDFNGKSLHLSGGLVGESPMCRHLCGWLGVPLWYLRFTYCLDLGGGVAQECPLSVVAPSYCSPVLNNYNQFLGCRPRFLWEVSSRWWRLLAEGLRSQKPLIADDASVKEGSVFSFTGFLGSSLY